MIECDTIRVTRRIEWITEYHDHQTCILVLSLPEESMSAFINSKIQDIWQFLSGYKILI